MRLLPVFSSCYHTYPTVTKSLAHQPSLIGYIAKARAQVGQGEQELAFEALDVGFRDCDADETRSLLLIKVLRIV